MKKYLYLSLISFALLASCAKEQDVDRIPGKLVTFTALTPETKASLGEKDGTSWPVRWGEGDKIAVNGVASEALSASEAGTPSAQFIVTGVSAPYHAVSPASAVSGYSADGATITIPSSQTWYDGSFDPQAYVMTASSSDEILNFSPEVALFSITPTGEGDALITSVRLVSENGQALSGALQTDWSALTAGDGAESNVQMSSPDGVPLGTPWVIAIAPVDLSSDVLQVIITDADGGVMIRKTTPSKAYAAGRMYSTTIPYTPDFTANVFGTVTCEGAPVEGVLVSDGVEIVQTDADGRYWLQSAKKWKYVFITIPRGYEAPLNGILPNFWKPLTADADAPEQVDFTLHQAANDDYTLLVLGDMHLARRTDDLAQFEKVAGFMNQTIDAAPGKVYCLTLGDMTWDMYWLANNFGFSDYLQTMNGYFSGIPFFHTMGNHDNEMEVSGDYLKALKYTENLSPDYYSFNLGKIHYIVMDNMDFTDVQAGEEHRSEYRKNFTAEQLEWLRKDLSYVDKSTPIFVTAHEPLARPSGLEWNEILNGDDADLDTFIDIFDGYNVQFLSGHTHNLFNRDWTPTFTEHNSGAVCASWWWSGYITPGIHIAQDGAPGGFTVWTVNGTETTHYYQAALQSRDYQFRAYDMNEVKATITEDLSSHSGYPKYYNHIQGYGDNVILVNVWDYDDDWTVEISENGTPLSVEEVGVYDPLHIYAMTIPRLNNYNTTTFSTAKWRHFFQATASAPDTPVTVKVTDRYGNVYTEEMTRPKAFTIDDYKNEVQYTRPEANYVTGSSSSLVFGWTVGGTAAEDADVPYKLELFSDSACSNPVVSFDIPAGSSCWGGKALRFTFGSLQPSTTYYFKVTNTRKGESSDVISGTTDAFTVVDPSTVSNAGAGDVILAEDFSEIGWGADMLANAAGFIPAGKPLDLLSGNYTTAEGSFLVFDNTSGRIYGETRVTSDKRLYNWGFFGNSSVYAYAGYLRVGSSSTGARTHIVSPALSGIPEGKTATVDVTVTSSVYNSGADVAVFVNDHSTLTLVLAPDQKESTDPKFSSSGGKYTGASLTNGYPLDVPVKQWATKTVRIEGVTGSDCLLIGSHENVDTKNRFFLDDVKVQIVSLKDTPSVAATMEKSTSCSLTFTWTEGAGAATDVSKPWTIALYRDAACTDLVVSHNIDAGSSKWSDRQPRFIFGGLDPDTDYWFKATDTTEGDVKVSNVVKATTQSFTRVDASKVSNAGIGDIILAEDFSETYGPDEWDGAAGYMPSSSIRTLDPPSGEDPAGSIEAYNSTGTRFWGNGVQMTEGRRLANGWGFFGNSSVYSRSGYLRVSVTTSGARTHIVTPRLAGIPDGYKATISVTVTALQHEKASDVDVAVFFSDDCTMYTGVGVGDAKFCKYKIAGSTTALPDNGVALGLANTTQKKWYTKTIEIEGVSNQSHLIIGSLNNVNGKTRFNLADVVVKIVDLNDPNRTTKVSILGDSISTFSGWCDKSNIPSGKSTTTYYPKADGDVLEVGDTWWYKVIYNKMVHGTFEKNISAGNTTVVQNTTGDSSLYWYGWDFGTRLQRQGLGDPDVVFIYGGTNDLGHLEYNNTSEELIDGVEMNASSFPDDSQSRLEELYAAASAATTVSAADALDGTTFCSAYIRLLQMIKVRHPAAKVVCIIGDYLYYGQGQAISRIAELFGDDYVRVVDILSKYGYKANSAIPKYSYAHPTKAGMSKIADEIALGVLDWIDE
jgi:hypothetical protein